MTWFSKRFFVPLIPRNARPINTMHYPPSTIHALFAVALMPGCADLQWQKPGATAEALETDLAECRGEARRNAGPDPRLVRPDAGRIVGIDSTSRPVPASSGRLDGDRFLVEHDLTRICMNRRGYELVPAGPAR